MSVLREYVSKRDKRAYGTILRGALYHRDKKLRFLTFTLPMGFEKSQRRFVLRNIMSWLRSNYGEAEYFSIETDEGNGVFHIILANKKFIPFKALQDSWKKKTGAYRVNIKLIEQESEGVPVQKFLQEMTRQFHAVRYTQSRGWLKPGTRDVHTRLWRLKFESFQEGGKYYVLTHEGVKKLLDDWIVSDQVDDIDLDWGKLKPLLQEVNHEVRNVQV